jgi:hypothetical protein
MPGFFLFREPQGQYEREMVGVSFTGIHFVPGRCTLFVQKWFTCDKNYPFYIGKYTIKKVAGKKEVIYCLPIIVVPVRSVYRQGT